MEEREIQEQHIQEDINTEELSEEELDMAKALEMEKAMKEQKEVKTPQIDEFTPATEKHKLRDIDFILDIPLEMTVLIGRTKILVQELLQLTQGSVVALDKLAGEPMEVYVNGKLIGRGEVVVVNEKFGIRITDIISPQERVKQLG
ncbi:MAG: flagellar motor switch protein FliN [Thermodesulfovibrio sp.]|jgi:flagellar motor switch protein FliN/FliY|uniref:flagellar motor switch protein FliN n=1 Tax=unclassified Thermodesulfovibrio TaxID=2645936 RepID=UPI00083B6DAC|nr:MULTISPECIES: flagellar motor switch protein FliN [unclassified Thermodesulfovibrio]MDI1471813.1 flagellar motor switch protein FliN [Thermodesulfovibrio sp. 1176]MDI6713703.1 flagellar motor switch protein FliN [Thermodesulfovibrio sp.]ODA43324.1 Flagellar motor switch protein FliN [Thermodesulfovibrio sp. N1]